MSPSGATTLGCTRDVGARDHPADCVLCLVAVEGDPILESGCMSTRLLIVGSRGPVPTRSSRADRRAAELSKRLDQHRVPLLRLKARHHDQPSGLRARCVWRPPQLPRRDSAVHQRILDTGATTSLEEAAVVIGDAGDEPGPANASIKSARAHEEVVCVRRDAVCHAGKCGEYPRRFSGLGREVRMDVSRRGAGGSPERNSRPGRRQRGL